jgi:hypothetical protein
MLLDVLKTHRAPQELEHIGQAASEFLVEVLAVFEMTQRGFIELLSLLRSDQNLAPDIQAELERQQVLERATGALMERHGLSRTPPPNASGRRPRARASPCRRPPPDCFASHPRKAGTDRDDSACRLRRADVMPAGPRR